MRNKLCQLGILMLAACGSNSHSDAPPDAPPDIAIDMALDSPPSVTIRLDPPGEPALVAFQDGDGAWQVAPGSNGVYYARVGSNRYAVAVACSATTSIYGIPYIQESYQTLDAGSTVTVVGCTTSATEYSNVTVELSGAPTGTYATRAWLGDASTSGTGNASLTVSAAHGKSDVFVSALATNEDVVYRGPTIDVQGDQTISVDLATAGHHLESHGINVSGFVPNHQNTILARYGTTYSHGLWPLGPTSPVADTSYRTIEASGRQPGDITDVEAYDFHNLDGNVGDKRSTRVAFADPVELSLAIPAEWPAPVPSVVEAATLQTRTTLPVTPATLERVDYTVSFRSTTDGALLELYVDARWLGAAPGSAPTITTPDLSHLPGWLPEMGLRPGESLDWFVYRNERNMPPGTPAVDGRRIISNVHYGTQTPP